MKRPLLATLALSATVALPGLPATALDLETMSDTERQMFHAEIRAYLLKNPEVIMEAVAILEEREARAKMAQDTAMVRENADEIFNDGHSWVGGNPDGDITLVEFMDYRCGYCRRAAPDVESFLESDGNIRLVIKEYPILGEQSVLSSRFAIATQIVAGDEAYKAVHDALLAFKGDVNEVALARIAETLVLDAEAILAQMDSPEVSAIIAANHQLAQRLEISGTPSFVLDDRLLRGYLPAEAMAQIAEEVRVGG